MSNKKNKKNKKIIDAKEEIISINASKEELAYIDPLSVVKENIEENVDDSTITEPTITEPTITEPTIIEPTKELKESAFFQVKEKFEEKPVEKQVFQQMVKKEKQVFQITYYDDKEKEIVYYTEEQPMFLAEFGVIQIVLTNCFKRFVLSENILNKKLIKVAYKSEQTVAKISIDLRIGVVIKTVVEAAWMKTSKIKAEDYFKSKVLDAYREFAKEMQIVPTSISDNNSEFEPLN